MVELVNESIPEKRRINRYNQTVAKTFKKILTPEKSEVLFRKHREKFDRLLEEIDKLKDPNNPEILTFAAFLIEIQEIEFHLLILITELRLSVPRKAGISIKVEKDAYEMTLGEMKNELDKFDGSFLEDLRKSLGELNKLRRRYSHHLFSGMDDWDKVMEDARKGIALNSSVLHDLFVVSKYISEHTEIGKLINRKAE